MAQQQKKWYVMATTIGITLGLLIAIGVAYFVTKVPVGIVNKVQPAPNPQELLTKQPPENNSQQQTNTTETKIPVSGGTNPPASNQTQPTQGNNFSKLDDKTRFEFYKILPNTDEAVNVNTNVEQIPNKKAEEKPEKSEKSEKADQIEKKVDQKLASANESGEDTKPTKASKTEKSDEDKPKTSEKPMEIFYIQVGAFKEKAQADALKSRVKNGLIFNGDDGLHRVRVGPFTSQEQMRNARSEIEAKGLPANVVRIKK